MRLTMYFSSFLYSLLLLTACADNDNNNYDKAAELMTPPSDCFWQITSSPGYFESDNNTWTDLNAGYAVALYLLPEEGSYLTLENQFPYARLMSYTNYRALGGIIDTLTDKDITPDGGSTNPFVVGAARKDPSRIYSVMIKVKIDGQDPGLGHENIIDGSNEISLLTYRVYLPDISTDALGNAELPRVTLHKPDGSILQGEEACAAINFPVPEGERTVKWYTEDEYAGLRESSDPSRNPPAFRATYNFPFHKQCDFGRDCSSVPDVGLRYPFPDPRYLYGFISREHGEVLVLRGKLPETPATYNGEGFITIEGQLRYWSICNYEYFSSKAEACLFDEQVEVNEDGFYTIVVSRDEDLPSNATDDCGVSHLAWSENGDGFGVLAGRENNSDDGFLLVRNIIPSPDFTEAIPNPDSLGEEDIMGEFLTKGRYFSKAEFEDLGCDPWLTLPYAEM